LTRRGTYPRDYSCLTHSSIETRTDVIGVALETYYSDADEAVKCDQLLSLLSEARCSGIDVSERELATAIKKCEETLDEPPGSYSWVHLNVFQFFKLQGRCYPRATVDDLFVHADSLPGPARPTWEQAFEYERMENHDSTELHTRVVESHGLLLAVLS